MSHLFAMGNGPAGYSAPNATGNAAPPQLTQAQQHHQQQQSQQQLLQQQQFVPLQNRNAGPQNVNSGNSNSNSLINPVNESGGSSNSNNVGSAQKSFWQAITMGCYETVKVLLDHKDIDINLYDLHGEQRQGGTALHLAILEMPTWKGSEGRNGIQTADFIKKFILTLLEYGANTEMTCRYKGEWYLQTAAGKTKSFFPEEYDALGLVLQFIEITRGADVIANDVTKRLELIRDILLQHIHRQDIKRKELVPGQYRPNLSSSLLQMFETGKFADVVLHCEDSDHEFRVHRVVLAARSVVFDRMFNSTLVESHAKEVMVKEVDAETLRSFLKFMYTDTIENKQISHASDLLVLANRYDVADLKSLCTEILAHRLTVQNAASILFVADSCHAPGLKRCALRFISENIKVIRDESEDYANLDANLMREILESVVDLRPKKRLRLNDDSSLLTRTRMFATSTPQMEGLASPVQPPNGNAASSSSSASSLPVGAPALVPTPVPASGGVITITATAATSQVATALTGTLATTTGTAAPTTIVSASSSTSPPSQEASILSFMQARANSLSSSTTTGTDPQQTSPQASSSSSQQPPQQPQPRAARSSRARGSSFNTSLTQSDLVSPEGKALGVSHVISSSRRRNTPVGPVSNDSSSSNISNSSSNLSCNSTDNSINSVDSSSSSA